MDLGLLDLDLDWYGLDYEFEDSETYEPDPGVDSVLVYISALLLVWFFSSLFWASIWGKGIFRCNFAIRAILLSITCCFQIRQHKLRYLSEELVLGEPILSDYGEAFSISWIRISAIRWEILVEQTKSVLFLTDQFLTLVLLGELYLCTCKLEIRQANILYLGLKAAASLILFYLISSLRFVAIILFNFEYLDIDQMRLMTRIMSPSIVLAVGSTVETAFTLYYGFNVAVSLLKSHRFRAANGSSSAPPAYFLPIFVLSNLLGQAIKLSLAISILAMTSLAIKAKEELSNWVFDTSKVEELYGYIKSNFVTKDNLELGYLCVCLLEFIPFFTCVMKNRFCTTINHGQ